MNSNQSYPNPRMDLIPLLMENQSPKDPATKTILKIVKNFTQKRICMIEAIPRRLNTRKKASGLFCIPPTPPMAQKFFGGTHTWANTQVWTKLHPSVLAGLKCDTPLPCGYFRVIHSTELGPAINGASMSGGFLHNTVLPSSRHFRKTSNNKIQDQVISSLL